MSKLDSDWSGDATKFVGYDDEIEKGNDMATIKTLQWDDDGNDLVRDIETNEVLRLNWSNEKMREYINDNEKIIEQLTARNLKLKRKTKKLYKEVKYLMKQLRVLHQALFELKFRYEKHISERKKTPDGFMNIISKAFEKYYENAYYKRCEEDATND